jgi:MFS family permease
VSTGIPDTGHTLSVTFRWWLWGTLVSQLGDAALFFALTWTAAARGAADAGLVVAAISVPRITLLLLGGVTADRVGPRRVMIVGDAVMVGVGTVVAAVALTRPPGLLLLLSAALALGTVDAFYGPASSSMPARLASGPALVKAVSLRQAGTQTVSLMGAPLGGVCVAVLGLGGAAILDTGSFAVILGVLILRVPTDTQHNKTVGASLPGEILLGLRLVAQTRVLAVGVALVGAVTAFGMPICAILVPVVARRQHWSAVETGIAVAGQAIGMLLAAAAVTQFGGSKRPGLATAASLVPMSAGIVVVSLVHTPEMATVGTVVLGIGAGTFAANLGPMLMSSAPLALLSRTQSITALSASGSLLASSVLFGLVLHRWGSVVAGLSCASLIALFGIGALASESLRSARLPAPRLIENMRVA